MLLGHALCTDSALFALAAAGTFPGILTGAARKDHNLGIDALGDLVNFRLAQVLLEKFETASFHCNNCEPRQPFTLPNLTPFTDKYLRHGKLLLKQ
jgi:hypothetical protein